jgi:hypothetical protein
MHAWQPSAQCALLPRAPSTPAPAHPSLPAARPQSQDHKVRTKVTEAAEAIQQALASAQRCEQLEQQCREANEMWQKVR